MSLCLCTGPTIVYHSWNTSKKRRKKKKRQKHLHNVVECPLTQMRNQGSCFQINTYCFKMKLNGKQCFPLYPLSRPLNSLWTSFYYFSFLLFLFFLWLQVLLVSFTPTYVFSYFWLKINSVLSVSSRVTSYSLQWILENKFYICSPCRACFFFPRFTSSQPFSGFG